ncbi:dockerin type I domain-containing protein [Rubripirellula reticaptiva]|uniref:PKD domain-containing protein n=1 Tax=Rubripirellula reticaptiva TaxID=2528013 RepID=A0A5C6EVH4_9BACT|nr:dockerin type I domain-containing protein [Rubripirellula reticaptiva]TWU51636.1 hypothetical protein Poly59_32300 [Rubripirellula reticaptiva]
MNILMRNRKNSRHRRRLDFQSLERRQLLVAEGDVFNLSANVDTAGLVGNASAKIDWGDGVVTAAEIAGGNSTGPIKILFDYSLDQTKFFGTSANDPLRVMLQQAADSLTSRFNDTLDAVSPKQFVKVKPSIFHPSQGSPNSAAGDLFALPENPTIAANTIIVYAGARDLPGDVAGVGGGASISFSRTCIPGPQCDQAIANQNATFSRGEAGVLASPATDVAPLFGSISFDSPRKSLYYTGDDPSAVPPGGLDFFSIATHELAHALGFGTSDSWNTFASSGSFTGPKAKAAYVGSGNVPLSPSHWADSVFDPVTQPTLMRPIINGEIRTLFSPLDFAAMDDIGWEVVDTSAIVTASHRYLDDGNYTPVVLLEGSSLGRLTQNGPSVSVTNVAPTLTVASDETVTIGEAISIQEIGRFTDPGDEQEYTFSIDWGDGTSDDGNATVQQRATASGGDSAGAFGGSHTYAEVGSKTVTIRIQDDDGGFDQETMTINVLPAPSLALEISQSRIKEDGDVDAASLTVRRSGAAANVDTVISLSSDDATEATVPATVTIPAGQTTATVSISAVDDNLLDGDQTVTLSASGAGIASSTAQLVVGDAESISATVTGNMIAEQDAGSVFLVLARSNTDVGDAITVNIAGFDRSQLDLAASVEIAAGQQEVRVPIVPVDDNVPELTLAVTLTASAVFYESDSVDFEILDNEPPKFQNPVSRYDVNGRNGVTALDALRVINRLAIQTTPQLDPSTAEPNGVFLDVNGDYRVTAVDALQVINQLSSVGDAGSGETLAADAVDLVLRSPMLSPIQWVDFDVESEDDDLIPFEPIPFLT